MRPFVTAMLLVLVSPALAALNVVACEPEWGALAKELGGDQARIYVAATALQDPHRIEARPSLIARARSADLMVCTGAQLEIGWLPLVQQQSGNQKIQSGQPGYFEAASAVPPDGNPHIHLDPRNIERVAGALEERMAQLDPAQAGHYRERGKAFLARWREATERWETRAGPLK